MTTIPAEMKLVLDSGFTSSNDALNNINEFNAVDGFVVFRTIEGNIITMKILDYFIKYLDDEAC